MKYLFLAFLLTACNNDGQLKLTKTRYVTHQTTCYRAVEKQCGLDLFECNSGETYTCVNDVKREEY